MKKYTDAQQETFFIENSACSIYITLTFNFINVREARHIKTPLTISSAWRLNKCSARRIIKRYSHFTVLNITQRWAIFSK